ncbi:MAG: hypothetical protein IJP53_08285 [Synergistaceae bacterium]|nr:hypothetical protein [Synergistaceae bacterium]
MSTAMLEIEPKLVEQAEKVFNRSGISYSEFVRNITEKAIMDLSHPEELPVPCIDDMTEKELVELFEEGMEQIRAGNYHTAEEVRMMMEEHYAKF